MRIFIFTLLLTISLLSCKSKESPSTEIVEDAIEVVEIDKDFVEFYDRFHNDSIFQMESINFPLRSPENTQTWTADNWILHRPFNDYDGKFRREFTPAGRIILERIYDANGFFEMKRRWAKLGDGYKLVFYNTVEKGFDEE